MKDPVVFIYESLVDFECLRGVLARSAIPVVLGLSTLVAVGQTNGIYADFTTSLGGFTCKKLDHGPNPV